MQIHFEQTRQNFEKGFGGAEWGANGGGQWKERFPIRGNSDWNNRDEAKTRATFC